MASPISRVKMLVALGGAASVSLMPATQASADVTTLRVSVVPIFDVAPLFAATAQGYFAAENLAVNTEQTQGGTAGIPGLVGGSFDIVYSNSVTVLLALAKGIDLRLIMEGAPIGPKPPDPSALLKRKGDPIKTGKDLEGKIVAVNALSNIQWMVTRSWVKATGGDPDKVTYIEIPFAAQLTALKNAKVDAALVTDPFLTIGLADTGTYELLDWAYNKVFANGPVAFWVVSPDMAQNKLPLLRAFVRAYRKGVVWANAAGNRDALINMISGYSKIEAPLLVRMNIPPANSTINLGGITKLETLMRSNGLLTTQVDVKAKILDV